VALFCGEVNRVVAGEDGASLDLAVGLETAELIGVISLSLASVPQLQDVIEAKDSVPTSLSYSRMRNRCSRQDIGRHNVPVSKCRECSRQTDANGSTGRTLQSPHTQAIARLISSDKPARKHEMTTDGHLFHKHDTHAMGLLIDL
jgi:hypothetical protein